MSVAHRWGRITKYTSLACLTLAILSTLVLNIISSYSNSHIQSKAEPISNSNANVNPSTLANGNDSSVCDNTNTNAQSCISMSISSSSSTSGSDLALQIPQGGGVATGRHTVNVTSNNVTGYEVTLSASEADNNETSLVNDSHNHRSEIPATSGNLTTPSQLANNTWGYTLTNPAGHESDAVWAGLQPSTNRTAIATTSTLSGQTDTYSVYYGVRVDRPEQLLAGSYQAGVVYTATTNGVPTPTIDTLSQNSYELGSNTNLDSNNRLPITITGTNLKSTYKVYLENNTDSSKRYDITGENITSVSDTQLKLTLPTDITNPDLEPGDYTIHVVTQGGEDSIGFTYTEKKALSVYDSVDNVRVDWDANMIPVYHTGDTTNAEWTSLTQDEINDSTVTWFNYTGKRWANAVTVKEEALDKYQNKHEVVDEADILGYWVYIPRYAYQVMRRDVADQVVTDDKATAMGGFNIKFETVDDVKKTPAACASSSSYTYYFDCVSTIYPGNDEALKDKTAWATHPAFTWQYTKDINGFDQTVELNGIWVGKFETTGTAGSPTVLPNKYHLYDGNIGDYYDIAQSIGIEDPNNLYGNAESPNYNNGRGYHGLSYTTSHMLKNSEWGAVAYLASSKYGAGVNEVQVNDNYVDGATGNGPNGGRYNTANGQLASTTNNVYGIYDMAGGAIEYVMGSYATNTSQSSTMEFANATRPPYVDLYLYTVFVNGDDLANNKCTWAACGGHALHETKNVQLVSTKEQSWGDDYSYFVYASSPWFKRGGYSYNSNYAGLFASYYGDGFSQNDRGFRVALLVNT